MKKAFSLILAAATVLTLSACNNADGSSTEADSSEAVVQSSSTVIESSSTVIESTNDGEVSDDPIVVPDDPDNPDPNNGGGVDNSGLTLPDNRAGRMVKAALATDNWSYMMLGDEETVPALFPELKLDDCEEYCIAYCPMSAQLQYAIAIKPKDGSKDAVKAVLDAFVESKKNDPYIYPELQVVAQNAILDEDGGYIYVVLHQESQSVADAMAAAK